MKSHPFYLFSKSILSRKAFHQRYLYIKSYNFLHYWLAIHPTTKVVGFLANFFVEPMYKNNEVIPRGSIIDIKSSDNILNKRIVVINDVEGMKINYETGTAENLAK